MKTVKKIIGNVFFALTLGLLLTISQKTVAQDMDIAQFDQRGVVCLQNFINSLLETDFNVAAQKAMQQIHKSDYAKDGSSLKQDRLNFSFKKAWQNAKFYANPIKITRVQKTSLSGIGFKETAQAGTSYKVWIGKKQGVNGMPAPIYVFFPADGGEPKVHDYGSL
jgi:hypothetical protein